MSDIFKNTPNLSGVRFPQVGVNNVGSYLVRGIPWLSGSSMQGANTNNGEVKFTLPYVSQRITVINKSNNAVFVHFDSRSNSDVIDQHHYIEIPEQHNCYTFDVRAKEIYTSMSSSTVNSEVQVIAELTAIHSGSMWTLSGSGINALTFGK